MSGWREINVYHSYALYWDMIFFTNENDCREWTDFNLDLAIINSGSFFTNKACSYFWCFSYLGTSWLQVSEGNKIYLIKLKHELGNIIPKKRWMKDIRFNKNIRKIKKNDERWVSSLFNTNQPTRPCIGIRLQITHLGRNIVRAIIMPGMAREEYIY